jgi:hypothetical protein
VIGTRDAVYADLAKAKDPSMGERNCRSATES